MRVSGSAGPSQGHMAGGGRSLDSGAAYILRGPLGVFRRRLSSGAYVFKKKKSSWLGLGE